VGAVTLPRSGARTVGRSDAGWARRLPWLPPAGAPASSPAVSGRSPPSSPTHPRRLRLLWREHHPSDPDSESGLADSSTIRLNVTDSFAAESSRQDSSSSVVAVVRRCKAVAGTTRGPITGCCNAALPGSFP
jgi:hypothetical protein